MKKKPLKGIILEAPDNCGKDTQIRMLLTHFARAGRRPFQMLHYSGPKVPPDQSKKYFEELLYDDMFRLVLKSDDLRVFALNRAHISESVYAPMYRGTDGNYIYRIEDYWRTCLPKQWDKLCLITFIDRPENLISRDDGLSHSVQPEQKYQEIHRFISSTNMSMINHKLIIDIDGKDPDIVHGEVMKFLTGTFDV